MAHQVTATGGGIYRYYVLIMLMLTFMFNITDRLVMSILIEDIKAEFLLSDTQIGLLQINAAKPIAKQENDKIENFSINLNFQF